MDYSNIRTLLEKYWEGETSLEEEAQLKQFFLAHPGKLPADLQEAAPLFQYFDVAVPTTTALPGKDELETMLSAVVSPATGAPVIKMNFLRNWMQYAAVVAMIFGIGYGIYKHNQPDIVVADNNTTHSFRHDSAQYPAIAQAGFGDTYQDPQQAYEETQKVLQLLSKHLNKGKQEMGKLNYFNEATEKVKEN